MLPTRRARMQSMIQEEIASALGREVRDPRIPTLTITSVSLTPDAKQATVFFTLREAQDESEEARSIVDDCIEGLQSAAPFLRRRLAKILTVRHVPELVFKRDRGLENAVRVHELLKQLAQEGEKS